MSGFESFVLRTGLRWPWQVLTVDAKWPVFRVAEDAGLRANDSDHGPHVPVETEHHPVGTGVVDLRSDGHCRILT
jgi:hypothetical protein